MGVHRATQQEEEGKGWVRQQVPGVRVCGGCECGVRGAARTHLHAAGPIRVHLAERGEEARVDAADLRLERAVGNEMHLPVADCGVRPLATAMEDDALRAECAAPSDVERIEGLGKRLQGRDLPYERFGRIAHDVLETDVLEAVGGHDGLARARARRPERLEALRKRERLADPVAEVRHEARVVAPVVRGRSRRARQRVLDTKGIEERVQRLPRGQLDVHAMQAIRTLVLDPECDGRAPHDLAGHEGLEERVELLERFAVRRLLIWMAPEAIRMHLAYDRPNAPLVLRREHSALRGGFTLRPLPTPRDPNAPTNRVVGWLRGRAPALPKMLQPKWPSQLPPIPSPPSSRWQ